MTLQTYFVNETTRTVTPYFTIKQMKVVNTSRYGLYMNMSPVIPDSQKFDYYVAPNSNLVTPLISASAVTWFAPSFTQNASVPQVTLFDVAQETPFSSPMDYYQFVSFPGFPFPITIDGSVGVVEADIILPNLSINKFQNVFFTLAPDPSQATENQSGLLLYNFEAGARVDLGAFAPAGGIVYYVPRSLPDNLTLRAFSIGKINNNFTMSLNAFQSEQPLFADYSGFAAPLTVPALGVSSAFHATNPPGFIWSIRGTNIAAAHTFDVILEVMHEIPITGLWTELYNQTFTIDGTFTGKFIVKPRIQLLPYPAIIRIRCFNDHATNNDIVMVQMKNL